VTQNAKPRVLIVEDDQQLLEAYRSWLNPATYEVKTCYDGAAAANMLRAEKFDAAMIDIKLPSMNGLQVASIARTSEFNRQIPIFIISGFVDDIALDRARTLGNIETFEKPIKREELVAKIEKILKPKPKASGYDVRIINAILKATGEVLEFYFGEAPKLSKPGVRRGPPAKISGATTLISISGNSFAGSLAIVAPMKFVNVLGSKIFQSGDAQLDQAMLSDMMGELGNQVIGKIKSAFGELGIKSNIGLPEVVLGNDHVVIHKVKNPVLFIAVSVGGVACEVEFCLMEREGFDIDETKGETAATGMLMFD
jgi:CheY-like chemotaxis protein/CheY-specific phosphatase CheX